MHDLTEHFVTALGELHRDKNVEPLVELFGENATLDKAGVPHGQQGKDGARAFWEQYRNVFGDVEASFRQTVTDGDTAYLEWTSRGTLANGSDFSYDGVSVLEGHDDTIEAFRTYYDTAAFLDTESAAKAQ